MKYDIFISYRRKENSGRSNVPMARSFKLEFGRRGYKVFFDYSECTDNYFAETILPAIRTSNYFVLVLTADCMARCVNEGDWVRREIEEALKYNIKIIPITPDNECASWPNLPDALNKLDGLQITSIHTAHMFEDSVKYVINNRFHLGEDRFVHEVTNELLEETGKEKFEGEQNKCEEQYFMETKTENKEDGKVLYNLNGVSFSMVLVKGCSFWMGAHCKKKGVFKKYPDTSISNFDEDAGSEESPVHKVTLSNYYIGETVVTQALWKVVMGNNPSYSLGDDLPVEMVSRKECMEFIEKLNKLIGVNFRLPTEAEWELAARGGASSQRYRYSGSNEIDAVAWYRDNSDGKTHPVMGKKANELGLFDMSGNVWEWCEDNYCDYNDEEQTNPCMKNHDVFRHGSSFVLRGGGFDSLSKNCRSTYRTMNVSERNCNIGFRLVLSETKTFGEQKLSYIEQLSRRAMDIVKEHVKKK